MGEITNVEITNSLVLNLKSGNHTHVRGCFYILCRNPTYKVEF